MVRIYKYYYCPKCLEKAKVHSRTERMCKNEKCEAFEKIIHKKEALHMTAIDREIRKERRDAKKKIPVADRKSTRGDLVDDDAPHYRTTDQRETRPYLYSEKKMDEPKEEKKWYKNLMFWKR